MMPLESPAPSGFKLARGRFGFRLLRNSGLGEGLLQGQRGGFGRGDLHASLWFRPIVLL